MAQRRCRSYPKRAETQEKRGKQPRSTNLREAGFQMETTVEPKRKKTRKETKDRETHYHQLNERGRPNVS